MIEKITLSNGVRILAERLEHVRSAAVGIWVASGSRHEPEQLSGISHFIEHMVFKGTRKRSASQIAVDMDMIGGQVNAFTTKECTCYYARALDCHLDIALDILCDIFFEPKMDDSDIKTERGVVLEEIDMYEDTPDDLVVEKLFQLVYGGTSLGLPILGNAQTLETMRGEDLAAYMAGNYMPPGTVVAISGSYSDGDIEYLKNRFSQMRPGDPPGYTPVAYKGGFTISEKPIEQNHLCIGFPSICASSKDRHTLAVLSAILGGGMSSRLFQKVREERGLCYSVYTFTAAHNDTGILGVYLALGADTEESALELTRDVLREFYSDGPTEEELHRAREQIKANVLMSMESMNTRMNHMARAEMLLGRVPDLDEIIKCYNDVSRESISALARSIFDFERLSFSAVGRTGDADKYMRILM